jgi:hypothetical protein
MQTCILSFLSRSLPCRGTINREHREGAQGAEAVRAEKPLHNIAGRVA